MGYSKIGVSILAVLGFIPVTVIAGTLESTGSSSEHRNPGGFKIYSVSKARILGESHTKSNTGVVVTSYTAVPQPLKIAKPLKVVSKAVKTEHAPAAAPQKFIQEVVAQKAHKKKPSISVSVFEAGMSYPDNPLREILLPVEPPPAKQLYISDSDVKQDIAIEEIPQPPPQEQLYPYPIQYRIPTIPLATESSAPLLDAPAQSYYPAPQYNFAYQVHDSTNGNNHGHSEVRNGDSVHGQYSVLDPDGVLRVVSYTSDPISGFKATVNRQLPSTSSILRKRSPLLFNGYSPFSHLYLQRQQ